MIEIPADPYPYGLDPGHCALVVIDMQRDFIEPGGFGHALGNDVGLLQAIVPTVAALIGLFRAQGWPVIHTRESHAPDLGDCPPAKLRRGRGAIRIGDDGPMGRILVRGEPGNAIVADCAPAPGELVVDKPGKGMFHATGLEALNCSSAASPTWSSPASPPRSACRPPCARPTTAASNACSCRTRPRATSPTFKAATLRMITAQGGIVGWVASFAALKAAVAA